MFASERYFVLYNSSCFIEEKNDSITVSLIFDRYGNQPTLNYFKIKQLHSSLFLGFAQISTDVPYNTPATTIEIENMSEITDTEWRR